METVFHEASFHLVAAERVGPVKHHHLDALLCAGAHHKAECAYEGVGTAAYVLNVIDDDVKSRKHLRGRLAVGAVDREHGKSRNGILAVLNPSAGIDVSPHPVLRGEELLQIDLRSRVEDVDGGAEPAVNPAGIGHKTDTFPFEAVEIPAFKDFYSGTDLRVEGNGGQNRHRQGYGFNLIHLSFLC